MDTLFVGQGFLLAVLGVEAMSGAVWRFVFANVDFYGFAAKRATQSH